MWFRVDDSFWSHPKVIEAGNAAIGLWARCGSWCAEHKTDGHIPAALVKQIGSPAQVRKLLQAGLWTETDDPCGYLMHDWPDYNPTRETWRVLNEKNTERQRRFRGKHQVNGSRNGVTNASPTQPNISMADVVAPGTGRDASNADNGKIDLAANQVAEARRERTAKEGHQP